MFTIQALLFYLCQATEHQMYAWCARRALLKALLLYHIVQHGGKSICSLVCSREASLPFRNACLAAKLSVQTQFFWRQ